jgi:hypothetical protein
MDGSLTLLPLHPADKRQLAGMSGNGMRQGIPHFGGYGWANWSGVNSHWYFIIRHSLFDIHHYKMKYRMSNKECRMMKEKADDH